MESYAQTKTRLSSNETHAEPKKRKRRGGNDSIEFLQEKSKQELEVRKKELEQKEKEQARLFENQREMMQMMQQQQQNMMERLSKLVNK